MGDDYDAQTMQAPPQEAVAMQQNTSKTRGSRKARNANQSNEAMTPPPPVI